ncbi:MAG: hypothetical protein AVDCRST_MAG11-2520, partial [uncultured Gemmatimonadaceae bacterium]
AARHATGRSRRRAHDGGPPRAAGGERPVGRRATRLRGAGRAGEAGRSAGRRAAHDGRDRPADSRGIGARARASRGGGGGRRCRRRR